MLILLILSAVLGFCLSAAADHSVVRREGDMDATQALDIAVVLVCEKLGITEKEIRGHWFYDFDYYENAGWVDEADGPVWYFSLLNPDEPGTYDVPGAADFPGFMESRLTTYPGYIVVLSAADGSLLRMEEETRYDSGDPLDWQKLMVPAEGQLQPQQALDRAYELLAEALGQTMEDVLREFRDYIMLASSTPEGGRFWYHAVLSNIGNMSDHCFNVWLDADTGEIVCQTDPGMFAGRYGLWSQGISQHDWYWEQVRAQESEWGGMDTWDYLQLAAFEERCYGNPYWQIRPRYALPGEGDCTLEEAESAALAWLTEQDGSRTWKLTGSALIDNENDFEYRLAVFEAEPERRWQLTWQSDDGRTEEVYVDAGTGQVTDDGPRG